MPKILSRTCYRKTRASQGCLNFGALAPKCTLIRLAILQVLCDSHLCFTWKKKLRMLSLASSAIFDNREWERYFWLRSLLIFHAAIIFAWSLGKFLQFSEDKNLRYWLYRELWNNISNIYLITKRREIIPQLPHLSTKEKKSYLTFISHFQREIYYYYMI